ncbi:MAG TPA: hypothetical protein VG369_09550 [Humibacter sp.]|nr:hypothetical protein [Humibacter sp.]
MKRHLRWLVPLASIPALYLIFWVIQSWLAQTLAGHPTRLAGFTLLASVVVFGGTITGIVLTIIGAIRVHRAWRHRTGHFTKKEIGERANASEVERRWAATRGIVSALRAGHLPEPIEMWGVIPAPGEVFFYSVQAQYLRYYGRDVSYTQTSSLFIGRPAFVAAGLIATAIGNSAARSRAEAEAAAQWRELQMSPVLLSNRRMVIGVNGQWTDFYFDSVSACFPDPAHWYVAFQFRNAVPLMLTGLDAPLISAFAVLATHGIDGLHRHPALEPLR